MEELKPCPFCGKPVYSESYSERRDCEYDIHCTNKKCILGYMDLLFIAGEKWNTRPIEDQLKAENERFRGVLREIANSAGIDACGYTTGEGHSDCVWKARIALKGGEK